jgi:hypothetical protein
MSNASASAPTPEEIIFTFGELMYRDNIPHSVGFVFYGAHCPIILCTRWFSDIYSLKAFTWPFSASMSG